MATTDSFAAAFAFLLVSEGTAYTAAAADKGGPTRFGVTQATLTAYRAMWQLGPATPAQVAALTATDAQAVYKALYWPKCGGDALADPAVATVLFDAGVLNGPATLGKLAQRAANTVANTNLVVDGALGPKSCGAINSCGRRPFLLLVKAQLEARYLAIVDADATQNVWLDGWARRTARYLKLAL